MPNLPPVSLLEWKILQFLSQERKTLEVHERNGKTVVDLYPLEDITADTKQAALKLIRKGLVSKQDNPWHRWEINDMGRKVAEQPKPAWQPPKPPPLQDEDIEVLKELEAACRYCPDQWAMPMECGGYNGSPHSRVLAKLTRHGLADCRQRGGSRVVTGPELIPEPRLTRSSKGSRVFRINAQGKALLDQLAAKKPQKGVNVKHNHYVARCTDCEKVVAAAWADTPKDRLSAEGSAKDWGDRGYRVAIEQVDDKGPYPGWCGCRRPA